MGKLDRPAARWIVLFAALVAASCCVVLTVRRRGSDTRFIKKSKDHWERTVMKSPPDVASQLRWYHIRVLETGDDKEKLQMIYDRASDLARRYPWHVTLQRRMLTLASDIVTKTGRDEILYERENRDGIVDAAMHLLSQGNIDARDLEVFTREEYFSAGEVLALAGGSEEALRRLAEFLVQSGRWDKESKTFLNEAWDGGMTSFPVSVAWALRKDGRSGEAIKILSLHVNRFPDDAAAHFAIADTSFYMKEYDWEFTKAHYKRVFDSDPDNVHYRKWYGIHLYGMKQYDRARAELKKAVSTDKPDAEAFFFLGKVNESLGNREKAKLNINRAVKLEPANDKYREALRAIDKD